jgi:hypothetical protein
VDIQRLVPAAGSQQPTLDSLGARHALAQNPGNMLIRGSVVVIGPHRTGQAQKPENQPVLPAFRARTAHPRRMHDWVHSATGCRRTHAPSTDRKFFRPLDANTVAVRAVTSVLLALIPLISLTGFGPETALCRHQPWPLPPRNSPAKVLARCSIGSQTATTY